MISLYPTLYAGSDRLWANRRGLHCVRCNGRTLCAGIYSAFFLPCRSAFAFNGRCGYENYRAPPPVDRQKFAGCFCGRWREALHGCNWRANSWQPNCAGLSLLSTGGLRRAIGGGKASPRRGIPSDALAPFYLRLPQAERELRKKQNNE